jgi:hypothetical protein
MPMVRLPLLRTASPGDDGDAEPRAMLDGAPMRAPGSRVACRRHRCRRSDAGGDVSPPAQGGRWASRGS